MKVKSYIINIDSIRGKNIITALFCAEDGDEKRYENQMAPEEDVIKAIQAGKVKLENAEVIDGKLKGTTGSLDRFKEDAKPLVVIKEIVTESGDTIGYRVCTSEGSVRTIRLKDILAYAKRKTSMDLIPFQNAIYVKQTSERVDHIKSFTQTGFDKEVVKSSKNKHSKKINIDSKENENAISKLDQIFNKEQQVELRKGMKSGVNIKIYGNPKLTAKKMKILREGLEEGLPVHLIASPEFREDTMKAYKADLKYGYDIRKYLNPEYSPEQVMELSLGLDDGLDISVYSDPKNTPETMTEIRMRLSHGIWKEELALPSGKWI